MPVIRQYSRQVSVPGVVSQKEYSADQFGAAEGRAMEGLGQAVTNTGERIAHVLDQRNTSDTTAKIAKANADLSQKLQQTIRTATPGDTKPFEDYNREVEETLGKIGEEATTQGARSFFQESAARIKGQLANTAAAGQAELAGIKAVNDYQDTMGGLTTAAMTDPSSLELQRTLHNKAIDNLVANGSLPTAKAMELRQQGEKALAVATMRGWIDKDADYARDKLKKGEFAKELGADGTRQLLGEVDQAVRAKEIDQERRIREQERITKVKQQQTQNQFLADMVEGKLDTKMILNSNLEAFGSGSKEQFLQMMKAHNTREIKTNPQVFISLFERIHLPDGDPDKIYDENVLNQEVIKGNLQLSDLNHLRDEMQGKGTEQGRIESDLRKQMMDIAKGKLTKSDPMLGIKDPAGDEQMQKFMVFFADQYKTQRAAGVPATKLLDPNSPEYLGKYIANYQRDRKQIMKDLVPKKRGSAVPSGGLALTPGVSPANAAPKKFIAPPNGHMQVKQNGRIFNWNSETGKYE